MVNMLKNSFNEIKVIIAYLPDSIVFFLNLWWRWWAYIFLRLYWLVCPFYFSRRFKMQFGVSPSIYQRGAKNNSSSEEQPL